MTLLEEYAAGKALWVALDPLPQEGLPPGAHCTIAYLGKDKSGNRDVQEKTVVHAALSCQTFADYNGAIVATVGGEARFRAPEQQAHVLLLQNPDIRTMRNWLLQSLYAANIVVQQDFDFTPHLTLQYLEPGDTVTVPYVAEETITFITLTVNCGDASVRFDLRG